MPFLYLPDAISLTLLALTFGLLRRLAEIHFQQELCRLRMDLLRLRTGIFEAPTDRACRIIQSQLKSAIELSAAISPARHFFVYREVRSLDAEQVKRMLTEPVSGIKGLLDEITDRKVRGKLRRIQLESDISLGAYFMFGSISGWVMAAGVLSRLVARALSVHSADRIDWLFDLFERVLVRLGRRTRNLSLLITLRHGA